MYDEIDTLTVKGDEVKHEYKHNHDHDEEREMKEEHVNVFAGGNDGNFGGGLGSLALLALLGGRGFGNRDVDSCAGSNTQCLETLALMNKLGNIEAQIPSNAMATQAVISNVGNDITTQTLQQTIALQGGLASQSLGIQQGFGSVKDAVQGFAIGLQPVLAGINQNISDGTYVTTAAIRDDGEKTRALITATQLSTLERQLTVAQLAATENASELRRQHDRREIEINIANSQSQNNLQIAQQNAALGQLAAALNSVAQDAKATSVAVNNGGLQIANPNNTANNTKV